ncbi:LytR family transcriptional regulator [Streptomyces triticagri]|uniref:LytR family transcriptional regulator n=1 Tax=Streptomyces triticagri TaxID=2293568 RepID=A0A372M4H7_9ACTN|nr:LCP family protein [Streptomyces triticagri]RFU85846.1 LytR family transcriptional regulator [Streptomyces triticagri]
MLWIAGAFSVLILAVAGVGAWVYQDLDGSIGAADIDGKVGDGRPEKLSPGSKNILVVGSDSRDGDNSEYGKGLTTMQSDTLMVVHIAADRKWATVVSFPRDSWVEIPACDKGDGTRSEAHHFKINEAFAIGGATGEVASAAACTIRAVEQNTGLRIDHFMSVDFQGFKGMVNALGGIEVCPEQAIHDKKAHLDLEAGCQTVKDEDALGYVRTRYSVGDGSDISRIGRQQEFMGALADRAKQKLTSPGELYDFLKAATGSLTTDRSLAGVRPLAGLATELKGVPEDRLTFLTVPNYPRELDIPSDRANVVWQYPSAARLFTSLAEDEEVDEKRLAGEAKNALHARDVRVRVLNGTDRGGLAGRAAEELRQAGYTVTGTGNTPDTESKTRVSYPADQRAQAQVLKSRLPGAAAEVSADATTGAVTLVVGEDFKSLR